MEVQITDNFKNCIEFFGVMKVDGITYIYCLKRCAHNLGKIVEVGSRDTLIPTHWYPMGYPLIAL